VNEGTIYRAFGQAVASRRRALGKTQKEVAEKLGLSRASLANIERGEQRVFLHHVLAFVDALELESAHEIVPARAVAGRARPKAEISMSGDQLTKAQKLAIKRLVFTLTD
jgi:transcriptional regulator with XRE-family HTH domain